MYHQVNQDPSGENLAKIYGTLEDSEEHFHDPALLSGIWGLNLGYPGLGILPEVAESKSRARSRGPDPASLSEYASEIARIVQHG